MDFFCEGSFVVEVVVGGFFVAVEDTFLVFLPFFGDAV